MGLFPSLSGYLILGAQSMHMWVKKRFDPEGLEGFKGADLCNPIFYATLVAEAPWSPM